MSNQRQHKRISFVTLGCAKNEVDTALMQSRLQEAGYCVDSQIDTADAIIINTCSFIQAATEESIDAIFDALNLKCVLDEKCFVVVAGCMPARYGTELTSEFGEVARFVPCAEEEDIAAIIDELFGIAGARENAALPPQGISPRCVCNQVSKAPFAYVKISDGCDKFCSYCTIPYIRGRYHSFSQEVIEDEVAQLASQGVREIVLIGQDTSCWGRDLDGKPSLARLLTSLAEKHPHLWLRVLYLQPEGINDELIDVVARHENICSYFDIPFQHCVSTVLQAMNRKGSQQEFLALIKRIRDRIPDACLRTTLIAGFPGETQDQFDELCEFVDQIAFDYVGVFPYSCEEGTKAAEMKDQMSEEIKLNRAQILRDRADAISQAIVASRIGQRLDVLVCGREEDGQMFGRAQCQAPDVDGLVYIPDAKPGEIVSVLIEDALLYDMEGSFSDDEL